MPRAISIPEAELEFKASRAGGPGGQHVNTSSTRVEVRWNPARSAALSDREKARLMVTLASRLDGEGWLRVVAATTRSQRQNRIEATERLVALVERSLVVPKTRKPTKTPAGERRRRLEDKRHRGRLKSERQSIRDDE
ncbi:MAG: alternative ribosome rescue aminoacyl-tRNA hydrolase ArfB [Gemmatimonadales bacterium]